MNETFLTFSEASKTIPGRPHSSAVWRWARHGVKVRGSQQRVKLQHVRAGARLLTTKAWLDEFMHSLARADADYFEGQPALSLPQSAKGTRTPEQRAAAADAARTRCLASKK
jgi:hypothetical protein